MFTLYRVAAPGVIPPYRYPGFGEEEIVFNQTVAEIKNGKIAVLNLHARSGRGTDQFQIQKAQKFLGIFWRHKRLRPGRQ